MFLDFYGLREQPFGFTPDPNYLYLSRTHGEALGALLDGIKADRGCVALIAEPVMETIRLVSDFETSHVQLLGIILSGQTLLAEKLAQPALSQLKQRIAIVRRLERLSADETACYIEHRLKVAGYTGSRLFEPEALALIGQQSQGIPREINNLCFNALSLGEARRSPTIRG